MNLGRQHLLAVRRALTLAAVGAAILLAIGVAPARAGISFPYSCGVVRWYFKHYSAAELEQLARRYGVTDEQRREAMKCLKR